MVLYKRKLRNSAIAFLGMAVIRYCFYPTHPDSRIANLAIGSTFILIVGILFAFMLIFMKAPVAWIMRNVFRATAVFTVVVISLVFVRPNWRVTKPLSLIAVMVLAGQTGLIIPFATADRKIHEIKK